MSTPSSLPEHPDIGPAGTASNARQDAARVRRSGRRGVATDVDLVAVATVGTGRLDALGGLTPVGPARRAAAAGPGHRVRPRHGGVMTRGDIVVAPRRGADPLTVATAVRVS